MTRIVYNFAVRVRNLIVGFVPIVLAAVIAAINTVTDKSPKGYAFAALTALATVFVSPAFQGAELKAKIVPPSLEQIVAAQVEAALRAHDPQSVAPSTVAVDPARVDPAAPIST